MECRKKSYIFCLILLVFSLSGCSGRDPEPEPPIFAVSPSILVPVGTEVTLTLSTEPKLQSGWDVAYQWWTLNDITICKGKTCTYTSETVLTTSVLFHTKIYGKPPARGVLNYAQGIEEHEYDWNVQEVEFY